MSFLLLFHWFLREHAQKCAPLSTPYSNQQKYLCKLGRLLLSWLPQKPYFLHFLPSKGGGIGFNKDI